MISPLLALLIKEVGQPFAEKMWSVLSGSDYSNQLSKAADTAQKGMPALQALHEAFGKNYFKIVNDAISYGSGSFTFEAGTNDYISVNIEGLSDIEMLRMELNTNLERIIKGRADNERLNYFKGVLKVWESQYKNIWELNDNELKAFDSINKLLESDKKNTKQIFNILCQATSLTMGILLIGRAIFLTMGVGVGLVMKARVALLGIPGVQIASFAVLGAILLVLSFINIKFIENKEKHVMSICVSLAYKLLNDREKSLAKESL